MHASGDCGYPIGLEVIVGFVVALAAHPTRVCIHQAEHEQWRPVVVTYCNVMYVYPMNNLNMVTALRPHHIMGNTIISFRVNLLVESGVFDGNCI